MRCSPHLWPRRRTRIRRRCRALTLVIGVRDKVDLIVDRSIHEASVDVTVETTDGQKHHIYIERAIGSLEKPMSNEQLKAKFVDQSTPILGAQKTEQAWNLCMSLASQQDLKALLKSLTLEPEL